MLEAASFHFGKDIGIACIEGENLRGRDFGRIGLHLVIGFIRECNRPVIRLRGKREAEFEIIYNHGIVTTIDPPGSRGR